MFCAIWSRVKILYGYLITNQPHHFLTQHSYVRKNSTYFHGNPELCILNFVPGVGKKGTTYTRFFLVGTGTCLVVSARGGIQRCGPHYPEVTPFSLPHPCFDQSGALGNRTGKYERL